MYCPPVFAPLWLAFLGSSRWQHCFVEGPSQLGHSCQVLALSSALVFASVQPRQLARVTQPVRALPSTNRGSTNLAGCPWGSACRAFLPDTQQVLNCKVVVVFKVMLSQYCGHWESSRSRSRKPCRRFVGRQRCNGHGYLDFCRVTSAPFSSKKLVPFLSSLMPPLLTTMRRARDLASGEVYLLSALVALQKVAGTLPHFISPYLEDVLLQVSWWPQGGKGKAYRFDCFICAWRLSFGRRILISEKRCLFLVNVSLFHCHHPSCFVVTLVWVSLCHEALLFFDFAGCISLLSPPWAPWPWSGRASCRNRHAHLVLHDPKASVRAECLCCSPDGGLMAFPTECKCPRVASCPAPCCCIDHWPFMKLGALSAMMQMT